jgi:hypothetical protein
MSQSLLDKIKAETEKRKPFDKVPWFKAKPENTIRILPNLTDPEDLPFVTKAIHWLDKKDNQFGFFVACLKGLGAKCPLCEKYQSIPQDDKNRSKYRPLNYNFYNVWDYSGGGSHAVFKMPVTLHEQVMMYATDLGGNVFDYKVGYDWKLTKTIKAGFPNYMIRPVPTATAFKGTKEGYDLSKLFIKNDLETMRNFLGEDTSTASYHSSEEDEEDLESAVPDHRPQGDDLNAMLKSVGIE